VGEDDLRLVAFFDVLARMGERSGAVIPAWLSTHPDPADRGQKILTLVGDTAPADAKLTVGEESFKRMLEGLTFGDDPREGFMDGNVFKHPDLRFQIAFPEEWRVTNTRQRVLAGSNDAAFEMTASRGASNADPQAQAARVFQNAGLQAGRGQSLRIGGFPAFVVPFRQQSQAGAIDGEAAFLRDGEMMYQIFAYTSPDRYPRMRNVFRQIFGSFSRLTDPEDLGAQPQRIVLYRVPRATSAREALVDSGVATSQLEEMAIVNHVRLEDRVEAGTLLKSVTRSRIQSARSSGEGNILGVTREYSR
jgi:predicted Zn-dependent protease